MAGPVDSLRPLCGVKAGERPTQAPPCLRAPHPTPLALSLHYSDPFSQSTYVVAPAGPPTKYPAFSPHACSRDL